MFVAIDDVHMAFEAEDEHGLPSGISGYEYSLPDNGNQPT